MIEPQCVGNRIVFLDHLPKHGICAEIGVLRGDNAINIYNICQPSKLILVDEWKSHFNTGDKIIHSDQEWEKMFDKVINDHKDRDNVLILRFSSSIAASMFADEYFDWVYIDAGHSYESCYSDLTFWYPKIKRNGILAGHDYTDSYDTQHKGFGVKKAVDQFMLEKNLTIDFVSDCIDAKDYAIIKRGY